jgi:hypothetical protein
MGTVIAAKHHFRHPLLLFRNASDLLGLFVW